MKALLQRAEPLGGALRVLLGQLDELVERLGISDGDLTEHLAIEVAQRVLESGDEPRVPDSARAAGRGNSRDPQRAKITLACSAIAIGINAGSNHGVAGRAKQLASRAVVA